jgi:uncharacterized protein YjbJ (UPF0337 family)
MNWVCIEENWRHFKSEVRRQWGKLSDDQFDTINGKREHLTGKIQELYGVSRDEAERQIAAWQMGQKYTDHFR